MKTINKPTLIQNGFEIYKEALNVAEQTALVLLVRRLVAKSPLYQPYMPKTGAPLNVKMTNLGELGWVSDIKGYRYQKHHPITNDVWQAIPPEILDIWARFTQMSIVEHNRINAEAPIKYWPEPECCLVNYYGVDNKMGLHIDQNEVDHITPVLSISLGDDAMFRMGGKTRNGKTTSIKLKSGDLVVFGNDARLNYHGVSKIIGGTSSLLKSAGRLNLTLRRVTAPSYRQRV